MFLIFLAIFLVTIFFIKRGINKNSGMYIFKSVLAMFFATGIVAFGAMFYSFNHKGTVDYLPAENVKEFQVNPKAKQLSFKDSKNNLRDYHEVGMMFSQADVGFKKSDVTEPKVKVKVAYSKHLSLWNPTKITTAYIVSVKGVEVPKDIQNANMKASVDFE